MIFFLKKCKILENLIINAHLHEIKPIGRSILFFFFFLICDSGTSFLKQAKVPCLPAWCLQALPSDSFAFLPVFKDTQQRAVLLPRRPDSLQIATQAVHLHLFSQNKLLSSDIKHHVSSFPLAVGKGKKNAPWSFLFVDFGISLESANKYSFFMLFWKALLSLPSHKAN